ncbi:MAG: T9SS type A sorting domain-containing protein, partial [Flavobacteriales bacterium]|nr:T9SS type A sorting domain-containing protein [Flavobacteriales bacterium]
WYNSIVTGARCFYWNDSALIAPSYGALYNWNAVSSPLNVCPSGWHVPSDDEWNAMTTFLDPSVDPEYVGFTGGTGTDIGDQLKEAGGAHWDVGNLGTNSSGFTARGGGRRESIGTFGNLHSFGHFWTSTYGEQEKAWCRVLFHGGSTIFRFIQDRLYGASIRCVADVTTDLPERREDDRIQLFPNPARDNVTLLSDLPLGAITVLDINGRVMVRRSTTADRAVIDLSELRTGLYMVRIARLDGVSTLKLMVE